jgi:predicted nucleotidyltransferase
MKIPLSDLVVQNFLRTGKDLLVSKYKPERLILFGSRATGTAHEDSDLDILIVSHAFEGQPFIGRMGKLLVYLQFPAGIDALCYTPDEFRYKLRTSSSIRQIVEEGIEIPLQ